MLWSRSKVARLSPWDGNQAATSMYAEEANRLAWRILSVEKQQACRWEKVFGACSWREQAPLLKTNLLSQRSAVGWRSLCRSSWAAWDLLEGHMTCFWLLLSMCRRQEAVLALETSQRCFAAFDHFLYSSQYYAQAQGLAESIKGVSKDKDSLLIAIFIDRGVCYLQAVLATLILRFSSVILVMKRRLSHWAPQIYHFQPLQALKTYWSVR